MPFLFSLLCNNDFPALAQNIGLACLTILIPVAIAIFDHENEFRELDNHVILDHVIDSKGLLFYLAMIFLPVFFWHNSSIIFRFIELLLWAGGVVLLGRSFIKSYQWLKGNKFPLRFDFLRKLTNSKDAEESWSSVWNSDKINSENESEFFTIFVDTVNQLFNKP